MSANRGFGGGEATQKRRTWGSMIVSASEIDHAMAIVKSWLPAEVLCQDEANGGKMEEGGFF